MVSLWEKKLKKNVLLCLYCWDLWSVIVDSSTPRRCGRGLWILFEQGNQCLLSWRCVRAIYTIILKPSPQNVNDVAENKLKVNKYRWNVTDSNKAIFDLKNCGQASAVNAHMNHFFVPSQSVVQTFSFRQFELYEIELVSCIILSEV